MRRTFILLTFLVAGCASRERDDAVSTTSLTSASLESISLVGETRSGLVVNFEVGPAKLTLRRRENTLAFRTDGVPSKRFRGATEFGPNVMVITKDALEDAYAGEPTRFVETFGDAIYGDSERVAPPALTPNWNALVVVTEQGTTTVETVSLRKVPR